MPDGDAAAAAGLAVVAGTADVRLTHNEINKSRDYTANHQTAGTHPASAITTGTLAAARIPDLDAAKVATGTLAAARIPNLDASKITAGTITRPVLTTGNGRFGAAWNNDIVSTRRSVWMEADGTLGWASSSRRSKKNMRPLIVDLDAVLALQPATFEYVKEGGGTDSGLIAEDVNDVDGAKFCVSYDVDGTVDGIHYDRLTVVLLALCQRQQTQIDTLAAQVAALSTTELS